jgi:hypothetical protein
MLMQVKQNQMQNIGLKKDRPEDRKLIVKESKLPKDFETSRETILASRSTMFLRCLSQNGFQVCIG